MKQRDFSHCLLKTLLLIHLLTKKMANSSPLLLTKKGVYTISPLLLTKKAMYSSLPLLTKE